MAHDSLSGEVGPAVVPDGIGSPAVGCACPSQREVITGWVAVVSISVEDAQAAEAFLRRERHEGMGV